MSSGDIAVIGAGLTGLTAASRMTDAGLKVSVFDKGRGLGGRLAGRRTEFGPFDHGAQVMHGQEQDFEAFLSDAQAAGTAVYWPQGGGWIGVPDMKAPLRKVSQVCHLHQSVRVGEIRQGADWTLTDDNGAELGTFSHIIMAITAPQAYALIGEDAPMAQTLRQVAMAPQWAAMLAFEDTPFEAFTTLRPGGAIDLIARMGAKPGRSGESERLVAHASADWTREHLGLAASDACNELLSLLRDVFGTALPAPSYHSAHRWLYSRCETPLGAPYLASDDKTLLVGGDWALGSDVGDAFASGRAMAKAVIGDLSQTHKAS